MTERNRTVEMIERLARLVMGEGHALGLKPAQWEALRYLARANRYSRTPGALAAYLGATKGTVSQTLMSLERTGLVKKTANPADRRSVRLDLTPDGSALLRQNELEKIRRAVDMLPEDARGALEIGLESLLRTRLAAGGGRPFGICRECRHFSPAREGAGQFCRLLNEPLSMQDAELICYEHEPA